MFKLLPYLILFFCFSSPSFASLVESTKPSYLNVYLQQNAPYSSFTSDNKVQGIYADYWRSWSSQTGIAINFFPYSQQNIHSLLTEKKPAVYSAFMSQTSTLNQLIKTPLLDMNVNFYHFSSVGNGLSQALIKENSPTVLVGGLLPQAQQLPLFSAKKNIIYKEYPGLLELLIDLYNGKIEALVFFSMGKENSGFLNSSLNLILQQTSVEDALYAYLPMEQGTLLNWLQWGAQFEQLSVEMNRALINHNASWWATSATMARNILLVVCLSALFILLSLLKRKKDRQFKDVLDSSPYPLAVIALDGNTIFYLNDEVQSLFSFKKKKQTFIFEDDENQLLLSQFINEVSHHIVIESALVRLLVNDKFHDIEFSAKRIHYKRQTAWLCHLKDVTILLSTERKLIEERELLRKVLDSIPEQIAFKSPKGTIIGCNTAWAKANSTTVSHATGRSVADMISIDAIKSQMQHEKMVWNGETYNAQEWIKQKNSTDLNLVNMTKVPLYNDKGTIFAILSIDSDITALHNLNQQLQDENLQRKETEKALLKQSVLLSTVFAASYDPIGLLDHEGRIIGANKSFAKLLNSHPDSIVGKLQSELMSSDRADWAERQNQEVLVSGKPIIFEELLFKGDKKTWYEVHKAPFQDDESHTQGIVIMARDITARKQTEEKLSSDASEFEEKMLNDQLTNIANRRSFDSCFTKLWQESYDEKEMLSIVMCDIDYFKSYNDNYGHQMGDEALKTIAHALQTASNKVGGFVARYGGEEFAIIIKGGNATKVYRSTEKIREVVNQTKVEHLYSDVSRYVTMSMGLSSMFPSDINTMNGLLAEADAALYDAKMSGRDQISVHD